VDARLEQLEPPVAIPRLISGELDVAVVFDPLEPDPRLETAELLVDHYRIVLHPGHRLAKRKAVRVKDLEGERLNGPRAVGAGVQYHTMLERLCEAEGFAPDVAYVVSDVTVARAFVASGLSVALMPELSIPHPRPDVVVKPLSGVDAFRTVYAVWVKGRRVPALAPMVAALRGAAARA
jgi:DNA-binding transcriptional LysR family regulator